MYLCAGVAVVGILAYLICIRRGKKQEAGIYFLILAFSGIFGILVCLSGEGAQTTADGKIVRPQPGEGSVQKDYLLDVENLMMQEPYRVVVENRHLTKRELEELFAQAVEELETSFLGENESLDHISKNVVLAERVLDGRVSVSWSFDSYEEVNLLGELQEEALSQEGSLVEVTATLAYEEAEVLHSFSMMVYPPEKSMRDQFFDALADAVAVRNAGTEETLSLPAQVAGLGVHWQEKKRTTQYTVLVLGLATVAAVAAGKKRDQRRERQKREARLIAEYPQMLSQMALLLGAGMTVSYAWERMVLGYESRCDAGEEMSRTGGRLFRKRGQDAEKSIAEVSPVYEEMRITYHQMKDGLGERGAYEQFGQRINLQMYRKFATLLVQNLRKGTAGLSRLLEKEVQEAFAAQESSAKKRGEELETKLLLPMMLMLGLVIVIIMIPAVVSFQL